MSCKKLFFYGLSAYLDDVRMIQRLEQMDLDRHHPIGSLWAGHPALGQDLALVDKP